MSRHNTMIYENMRPPVASDAGETPLRGKGARQIFQLANGEFEDRSGFKITKDQVVMNYTDDGKLVDANWNGRHHVTPSLFNTKNHKHYKVSESSIHYPPKHTSDIYFCIRCSNTLGKTSRIGTPR